MEFIASLLRPWLGYDSSALKEAETVKNGIISFTDQYKTMQVQFFQIIWIKCFGMELCSVNFLDLCGYNNSPEHLDDIWL